MLFNPWYPQYEKKTQFCMFFWIDFLEKFILWAILQKVKAEILEETMHENWLIEYRH